jgi:hypothetical protein
MKNSLKKSRKPIGTIFRHAVNKISPNTEKLAIAVVDKIKKNVPDALKETAKEVSKKASEVQQRKPLDEYNDRFKKETSVSTVSPVSTFISPDLKMRPIFQINHQTLYPHQLDQQALSKVLPTFRFDQSKASSMFSFDQSTISNVSPSFKKIVTQSEGGSVVHKKKNLNKISFFKSKTNLAKKKGSTIFNKSRRPFF